MLHPQPSDSPSPAQRALVMALAQERNVPPDLTALVQKVHAHAPLTKTEVAAGLDALRACPRRSVQPDGVLVTLWFVGDDRGVRRRLPRPEAEALQHRLTAFLRRHPDCRGMHWTWQGTAYAVADIQLMEAEAPSGPAPHEEETEPGAALAQALETCLRTPQDDPDAEAQRLAIRQAVHLAPPDAGGAGRAQGMARLESVARPPRRVRPRWTADQTQAFLAALDPGEARPAPSVSDASTATGGGA